MAGKLRGISLPAWLQSWLSQSIGNRVSLAAAGLAAGFVVAIGTLSFLLTFSLLQQGIRSELGSQIRLVDERFSQSLSTATASVSNIARSTLIQTALVDSSGRSAYVEPFIRDYKLPIEADFVLSLLDHGGRIVASSRPGNPLPYSAEWVSRQVDANKVGAEVVITPVPRLVLTFPVIFPGTGTAEGLLLLELPLQALMNKASEVAKLDDLRLLAGERGVVAAGNAHPSGIAVEQMLDLPAPLKGMGLKLAASRSWADVYGPLLLLGAIYAFVAIVALWLAFILARRAAREVIAPLRELTGIAESNRLQRDTLQSFPVAGVDEVGQLGRALQDMVETVQAERDQLEQRVAARTAELNDLAYIVRRTSNGVIVTDASARVEWVNEGFVRMTGYTLDEMIHRTPGSVLQGPDTDAATVATIAKHIAAGEGFVAELLNYHKDGNAYWVHIDAEPIRDENGMIVKFVALETDVTERRRVDQLKTEFVSVVSHELRTPLTAIRGALGLVSGGVMGEMPKPIGDLVDMALDNSERLTRLIDDLLDIQKLEAGKMNFEFSICALPDLIRDAVAVNQAYAHRHKTEIVVEGDVPATPLHVDAGRFQQVMANLLSNAIKFSPEKGTVRIGVSEPRNAWVRISVSDDGPGISDEFRTRIFQKFSQADASTTRSKQGTGLGLSITKSMVEHMDGSIGYESVPNQGATFYIDFPVAG